jgi:hypothetical protein
MSRDDIRCGRQRRLASDRPRAPLATIRPRSKILSIAWPGKLNLTPARRSHDDEKNKNDFMQKNLS